MKKRISLMCIVIAIVAITIAQCIVEYSYEDKLNKAIEYMGQRYSTDTFKESNTSRLGWYTSMGDYITLDSSKYAVSCKVYRSIKGNSEREYTSTYFRLALTDDIVAICKSLIWGNDVDVRVKYIDEFRGGNIKYYKDAVSMLCDSEREFDICIVCKSTNENITVQNMKKSVSILGGMSRRVFICFTNEDTYGEWSASKIRKMADYYIDRNGSVIKCRQEV